MFFTRKDCYKQQNSAEKRAHSTTICSKSQRQRRTNTATATAKTKVKNAYGNGYYANEEAKHETLTFKVCFVHRLTLAASFFVSRRPQLARIKRGFFLRARLALSVDIVYYAVVCKTMHSMHNREREMQSANHHHHTVEKKITNTIEFEREWHKNSHES